MADIRMLEKRVATLEQAAEGQRVASTGVSLDDLRMDELTALTHGLVPARDGERVRQILRGDLHTFSRRPIREQDITEADLARLERCMCIRKNFAYCTYSGEMYPHYQEQIKKGWQVLECGNTADCGHSPAVKRKRLLTTGAYIDPKEDRIPGVY